MGSQLGALPPAPLPVFLSNIVHTAQEVNAEIIFSPVFPAWYPSDNVLSVLGGRGPNWGSARACRGVRQKGHVTVATPWKVTAECLYLPVGDASSLVFRHHFTF